jgi:hypothetical protein
MSSRRPFLDSRLDRGCAYCGGHPDTKDHVPSKVLLDDPLPINTPIVRACFKCNNGFSLDEEYLACLLECVIAGSVDPIDLKREKIKRSLQNNPKLNSELNSSCRVDPKGQRYWFPNEAKVRNIILKLARGHVAFELSEPRLNKPTSFVVAPLLTLNKNDRENFERAGAGEIRCWPELGSRAFERALVVHPNQPYFEPWIVVQEQRYRYSVDFQGGVIVRIVISEYLACEIFWDE